MASSKSLALLGSIVMVGTLRKSRRPPAAGSRPLISASLARRACASLSASCGKAPGRGGRTRTFVRTEAPFLTIYIIIAHLPGLPAGRRAGYKYLTYAPYLI